MAATGGVFRCSTRMGEHELSLETGRIARQSDGAVLIRQGETAILVTAVAATTIREGVDFFPLTVEYRERLSAAGRFPGGYRKREARSTDREILICRLIDRSLRPLFPEGFFNEIQVFATVLSYQPGTDPEVLAITGASVALQLSDVPFHGPVTGVRVVKTEEGEFVAFPGQEARDHAVCELVVSLGPDGLIMIEGEAEEVAEEDLMHLIRLAAEAARPIHALQNQARAEGGKEKRPFVSPSLDPDLSAAVRQLAEEPMRRALLITGKKERAAELEAIRDGIWAVVETEPQRPALPSELHLKLRERFADPGGAGRIRKEVSSQLHLLETEILRQNILEKGLRADGRGPTQIRPIRCEAGVIPRVHGSSLFTRGETQALVVITLGTGRDEQEVESIQGVERERFQLFYSFPPYSVGEIRPVRGPGRREIGHGNLARRALESVLPKPETFPYTIKIESEITESNGSSSMATVCGGCLALLDGGVPVTRSVAGIAMGLIQGNGKAVVLSDILGVEDHLGDMDFKVAGTTLGVTAVQLDNKVGSVPLELLESALGQAREGRRHILAEMSKALDRPRKDLAPLAPRIAVVKIRPHRIRDLIGPGGRMIQELQADSGCKIDVSDDGTVRIYAAEAGTLPYVKRRVWELTGEPEVGKIYRGTVTGVKDFGCFVRVFQGIEGLVHASELGQGSTRDSAPMVSEGDSMVVKVLGVDRSGKIQLSRRAAAGVGEAEIENGE